MSKQVLVATIPNCDLCEKPTPAVVDGRLLAGPWAYQCERHWVMAGVGRLGTGYGQRLILDHQP